MGKCLNEDEYENVMKNVSDMSEKIFEYIIKACDNNFDDISSMFLELSSVYLIGTVNYNSTEDERRKQLIDNLTALNQRCFIKFIELNADQAKATKTFRDVFKEKE